MLEPNSVCWRSFCGRRKRKRNARLTAGKEEERTLKCDTRELTLTLLIQLCARPVLPCRVWLVFPSLRAQCVSISDWELDNCSCDLIAALLTGLSICLALLAHYIWRR